MKQVLLLVVVVGLTGCASAVSRNQQLTATLAQPINCDESEHQINALREQRATGRERLANGLATLLPTSAVFNLLAGEYSKRWELVNGEHNEQLYNRIMEIEEACAEEPEEIEVLIAG